MIVKCEQCQTRFKIPDEKVTDKGVKVRCTKCSHTFRVTRESAADAAPMATPVPSLPAPGAPGAGFDPFEQFGTAPEPKGLTTRPGFVPEAVEASRLPSPPAAAAPPAPWNFTDSGTAEEVHHEATRLMPLPVPVEARPPVPALPPVGGFDFDAPLAAPTAAPRSATPAPGQGLAPRGATPVPGQGLAPRGATPVPGQGFAPRGGTPSPGNGFAPRGHTPVPGQGVSGPRSFKPSAEPTSALPSVAPVVSPMAAKGPAAPAAVAKRPPSGSISRPAALGSNPGVAQARPAPAAKPAAPAPAAAPAVPPAGDLFAEFFTPGAPAVPLPDLPPPSASVPLPAPAAPQTPAYAVPFGGGDAAAFGSVDMDLSEAPPDLGPPVEFGAATDFDAPAPVPVAPPQPPPRPISPPTPAPVATKPRGGPAAAAPTGRLAPPAMAPPAMAPPAYAPPAAPSPMPASSAGAMAFDDPFGPSNVDLSAPAPDFDPAPPQFDPAPPPAQDFAPVPMPAPDPMGAPMPFADEDPFGSGGVDLNGPPAAAPAPMAAAPVPAPAPAAFGDDFAPPGPMDFGMLGDDQMPPESAPEAQAGAMDDPFAPPAQQGGIPDPFAPPAQQGGIPDPFAAHAQQGGIPDPFAAHAQQGGVPDPFAAHAQQGGIPDPFAAHAQQGGAPDPFANAEPAFSPTATGRQMLGSADASQGFLTQTDTSHQTLSPTDTGRSMLDLPSHDGGMQISGEEPGQAQGPTRELIDIPGAPEAAPQSQPSGPNLASPSIARPVGRPTDMGIPERRKLTTAQAVTGQVAYLTIAAGLLLAIAAVGGVYMKEGRVDPSALSPGQLMKLMTPSEFVASNVSNGLYDTRGGNSVFYVRGEVENRSSKPARVKVGAALYDGVQRVKSVEGLAGGVPSPEELHAVNTSEAAEQLRSKLDSAATVIAPGAKAPFTLVFQEFPQQLGDFRLKVTMEPAPEETAKP